MTCLRLVLGDQLNPNHPWFSERRDDVVYVLMEIRQETDYVLHHAQKILAIFAAMRRFAEQLREAGHRVCYLAIDDAGNRQSLPDNLSNLLHLNAASRLEYQEPDEWRLDQQLRLYAEQQAVAVHCVDSAHFLTSREEFASFFGSRGRWTMEVFYRHMRKRHGVLLEYDGAPLGGRWNFDEENRKPWRGGPPRAARPAPPPRCQCAVADNPRGWRSQLWRSQCRCAAVALRSQRGAAAAPSLHHA